MARHDGRAPDQLRPIRIHRNYTKYAEGAVLIEMGDTRVLCTATVEDRVPLWRRGQGAGWVTAEYGMLPRATETRTPREAARGKQGGRTLEIQRLIGRALRAVVDLSAIGERTITIDCDVLQADGGTRTAAITGAYVALVDSLVHIERELSENAATGGTASTGSSVGPLPVNDVVAAVSVGIVDGQPVLDLDYKEDVAADVDMNVVMTGRGHLIEVQGTAEGAVFDRAALDNLLDLATAGVEQIAAVQRTVLGEALVGRIGGRT